MPIESRPLDIDWCGLTDPRCPYSTSEHGKGINCGIDQWLRQIESRFLRLKEADRLRNLAQQNPDYLHELCAKGWLEH